MLYPLLGGRPSGVDLIQNGNRRLLNGLEKLLRPLYGVGFDLALVIQDKDTSGISVAGSSGVNFNLDHVPHTPLILVTMPDSRD